MFDSDSLTIGQLYGMWKDGEYYMKYNKIKNKGYIKDLLRGEAVLPQVIIDKSTNFVVDGSGLLQLIFNFMDDNYRIGGKFFSEYSEHKQFRFVNNVVRLSYD